MATNCGKNPCSTSSTNTAECESLPSQIQNFTDQFFGTVTKTEVNGVVSWILPCNLDVGLPNNSRAEGEGLACYFLRLFEEGIVGLTGPQGETGADGTNGNNAYTVTLASFEQPTLDNPTVTIRTAYNPAIVEGINIFVESSGWYQVDTTNVNGYINVTLTKAVTGATGTITAGKLVVPAGYPGASVQGEQGPQGPQGEQGEAGESLTEDNGQFQVNSGTDYALQVTSTAVAFTTSTPSFVLPDAGTYLLSFTTELVGLTGILDNDIATVKLFNQSIAADVPGSAHRKNFISEAEIVSVSWTGLYQTDGPSKTIALYGDCTTSDKVSVVAARTTMTYVRVE